MPNYSGQLTYIRKNLYSVIFFLDLSVPMDKEIMEQIFEFIQGSVPMRFGIIPIVTDDPNSPSRFNLILLNSVTNCSWIANNFKKFWKCSKYERIP